MQWNWLHLSDFHCGARAQSWLWPRTEQRFFEDLSRLHEHAGPWDVVFFTGDLVQQGLRNEFGQLDEWLERLWRHLRSLGSRPELLAVPGNHDLVRPAPDTAAAQQLAGFASKRSVPEEFWQSSHATRALIEEAFANYREWWSKSPYRPRDVRAGILPGDFATTVHKGALRIGIVGLNATFLQLADGNYKEKLALHPLQFHGVSESRNGPEWADRHHLCVLMTHQPPDWLMPTALNHLRGEISASGQFAVHLFGHMHEPHFLSTSEGGAKRRNHYQAPSLFGLEKFSRDGEPVDRLHGYAAGRLEVQGERTALLSFWPRIAHRKQDGTLGMEPDASYTLEMSGHTPPMEVPLLTPFTDVAPANPPNHQPGNGPSTSASLVIEGSRVRNVRVPPSTHHTSVAIRGSSAEDVDMSPQQKSR